MLITSGCDRVNNEWVWLFLFVWPSSIWELLIVLLILATILFTISYTIYIHFMGTENEKNEKNDLYSTSGRPIIFYFFFFLRNSLSLLKSMQTKVIRAALSVSLQSLVRNGVHWDSVVYPSLPRPPAAARGLPSPPGPMRMVSLVGLGCPRSFSPPLPLLTVVSLRRLVMTASLILSPLLMRLV